MSDVIADFLTRIRNSLRASHETVEVPFSRMKKDICAILKEEGYISDFSFIDDRKSGILKIYLKYQGPKKSAITGIRRESKPGRRVYVEKDGIPNVLGGLGIAIVSTSKGVLSNKKAASLGVGGELLCSVW
ncbi:MAG: 30S ribosomal protein S8 [Deltaproteobacteria bacterium]|nr:30S ribosomal protein S8 [Deltaproteobacteria bacterium]